MSDTTSKRSASPNLSGTRRAANGTEIAPSAVTSTHDASLERFARQAFAEDVERIDTATRARLGAARRRALDALPPRPSSIVWSVGTLGAGPTWALAGVAATLLLALLFTLRLGGPDVADTGGVELVADGERAAPVSSPVDTARGGSSSGIDAADSARVASSSAIDAADPARVRPNSASDDERIDLIDATEPLMRPGDLELLVAGGPDVLDVLDEDLEFYAWLEQQPELAAVDAGRRR